MPCHIANCPFGTVHGEIIEFNGKEWCRFHAPFEAATEDGPKSEWTDGLIKEFNIQITRYVEERQKRDNKACLDRVVFPGKIRFGEGVEIEARKAEFRGELDLVKARFPKSLDLSESKFFDLINLRNCSVEGLANFSDCVFEKNFDGTEATFVVGADFRKATFKGDAKFLKAHFVRPSYFDDCHFFGAPNFSISQFSRSGGDAEAHSFRNAKFHEQALFNKTNFSHWASFSGAAFYAGTNFSQAQVRQGDFHHVRFSKRANFNETKFYVSLNFFKALFDEEAMFEGADLRGSFRDAEFRGTANFGGALFGRIFFTGASFLADANFSSHATPEIASRSEADEISEADFANVIFRKRANFINRRFRQTTSFRNARFEQAPEFHQSVLHQDTDFYGTEFMDLRGDAAQEYRTLKLAMERVRNRRDEARFFALEQACLRKVPNVPVVTKVLSALYEGTSNYGQSVGIPLSWFILVNAMIFLFYFWLTPVSCLAGKAEVLTFTVIQIVRPFAIWSADYNAAPWSCFDPSLQLGARLISTLQALVNIGLLAMTILAIRWNFRRG